jgi:aryl-alcohol dehydrogenase-like predicted oxidoreductase
MTSHLTPAAGLANRRTFLHHTLGMGTAIATLPAANALFASPASAEQSVTNRADPDIVTRTIPRTKEVLPAIGLGTFLTFDVIPGQKRDHLREVMRRYWDAGARVIDTSPLYGTAEITVGDYATSLNMTGSMFVANPYHEPLTQWVERGDLDFVQVNYSIFNRAAEERLIPAAAERGIAVITNMPFEKARLFKVVEGRPLPPFAKDFGAENWAQFFLKWVISNPAVTCVLPATANPNHAAENVGALRGPLPDRAMRARMVQHMQTIPGFDQIAKMPWYPDKKYPGIIGRSQAELRARL